MILAIRDGHERLTPAPDAAMQIRISLPILRERMSDPGFLSLHVMLIFTHPISFALWRAL